MASHPNIVTEAKEAIKIAGAAKTVAVLGIKTCAHAGQPAYFVAEYLQSTSVEVIPVPVYYPDVKEILGKPVVRELASIKRPVDIVDVFRRPADLPAHVPDILGMDPRPAVVWLQSGISNPEVEQQLSEAGIKVVVSRCLKVDRAAAGHRSRF
jgi:predicted CoA-binding protein